MTDITGNFSVGNSHGYSNDDMRPAKIDNAPESCPECNETHEKIDLGKDPAAISNEAMVKSSRVRNIGSKDDGAYKYNPDYVKADVLYISGMLDTVAKMQQMYMDKGLSEKEARDKALAFADALIYGSNQE